MLLKFDVARCTTRPRRVRIEDFVSSLKGVKGFGRINELPSNKERIFKIWSFDEIIDASFKRATNRVRFGSTVLKGEIHFESALYLVVHGKRIVSCVDLIAALPIRYGNSIYSTEEALQRRWGTLTSFAALDIATLPNDLSVERAKAYMDNPEQRCFNEISWDLRGRGPKMSLGAIRALVPADMKLSEATIRRPFDVLNSDEDKIPLSEVRFSGFFDPRIEIWGGWSMSAERNLQKRLRSRKGQVELVRFVIGINDILFGQDSKALFKLFERVGEETAA